MFFVKPNGAIGGSWAMAAKVNRGRAAEIRRAEVMEVLPVGSSILGGAVCLGHPNACACRCGPDRPASPALWSWAKPADVLLPATCPRPLSAVVPRCAELRRPEAVCRARVRGRCWTREPRFYGDCPLRPRRESPPRHRLARPVGKRPHQVAFQAVVSAPVKQTVASW